MYQSALIAWVVNSLAGPGKVFRSRTRIEKKWVCGDSVGRDGGGFGRFRMPIIQALDILPCRIVVRWVASYSFQLSCDSVWVTDAPVASTATVAVITDGVGIFAYIVVVGRVTYVEQWASVWYSDNCGL